MDELYNEVTPETEEENSELFNGSVELHEYNAEEFTEIMETVEDPQEQLPSQYTEALYITGGYIASLILFAVFAILGFLAATHIFGRAKL